RTAGWLGIAPGCRARTRSCPRSPSRGRRRADPPASAALEGQSSPCPAGGSRVGPAATWPARQLLPVVVVPRLSLPPRMSFLRSAGRRSLLALCLAGGASEGDAEELSVSGSVTDRTGAVVRAARVSLMNARGGVLATASTGEDGAFAFRLAEPGSYLLVTRASGLEAQRTALEIADAPVSVAIVLEPAARSEEVTVTADPGLVTSVDAAPPPVN